MSLNSSESHQKYFVIVGIAVIVVGLAIWYFGFPVTPVNPPIIKTHTATGTFTVTGVTANKPGCDTFTGAEKTTCEKGLADSEVLTKLVAGAAEKGDLKLCDTVPEGARSSCKDIVYYEKAIKSRQTADCNLIKETKKKDTCKKKITPIAPSEKAKK